jgi:ABC-type multidrug transport system ATPase subunit
MLSVNHVTKKYGNFTALEDISLDFENGVYGLLAPNGAGKTTLIKMIATLLFPTQGDILWDGTDIIALKENYRERVGYLPQEFGYYKNYSLRGFLNYLAALKGLGKDAAASRITELLEVVSLSDVADTKMKKFSGGMIQRAGIAQAMLGDPKILILDEPTAGLDPKERVRFRNLVSMLSKDRIVILSTHIVSDIETIANKVIMFKDHRLFCSDSPAGICKTLEGKVYETWDIGAVAPPYLVLTERQEGGRTLTRFAASGIRAGGGIKTSAGGESLKAVSPGLEDVFLYVFRDEAENDFNLA